MVASSNITTHVEEDVDPPTVELFFRLEHNILFVVNAILDICAVATVDLNTCADASAWDSWVEHTGLCLVGNGMLVVPDAMLC